jgi:predicted XRE-type DNA-binding protein
MRVLRERQLDGAKAAELAGVAEADISRVHRASLDRFIIDSLVRILSRLDWQLL